MVRGFCVTRERLAVDVDLDGSCISGGVALEAVATSSSLESLSINCRVSEVASVTVNGVESFFRYCSAVVEMGQSPPADLRRMVAQSEDFVTNFEVSYESAFQHDSVGELEVVIPVGVHIAENDVFEIAIAYRCTMPMPAGIRFVGGPPSSILRHLYIPPLPQGGRCWRPCVDDERMCFKHELQVTARSDLVVITSGSLVEQMYSQDEMHKTWFYSLEKETPASAVTLVVGPFVVHPDPLFPTTVTFFCLPSQREFLEASVGSFSATVTFFEKMFGSQLPYGGYSKVFVDDIPIDSFVVASPAACVSVLSVELLHSASTLDESLVAQIEFARALCRQYFGVEVRAHSPEDKWVLDGAVEYATSLFVKSVLGDCEFNYRLLERARRVMREDIDRPALWSAEAPSSFVSFDSFRAAKAECVFHMLDRRVDGDFTKALRALVREAQSSKYDGVSTYGFLRCVLKIFGMDVRKSVLRKWIFEPGCPRLDVHATFSRGRVVVLDVKNSGGITGPLTVHLFEAASSGGLSNAAAGGASTVARGSVAGDGVSRTPLSHTVQLAAETHRFDFTGRHPAKKKRASSLLLGAARGGQMSPGTPGSPCQAGLGATDEASGSCADGLLGGNVEIGGILFARLDPEGEWLLVDMKVSQPSYGWASMLRSASYEDVPTQLEAISAIEALALNPTSTLGIEFDAGIACLQLAPTMEDPRVFYRVRAAAAFSIARLSGRSDRGQGLEALLGFFRTQWFDPTLGHARPNRFLDFPSYELQRSLVEAVGFLGKSSLPEPEPLPTEAVDFLLDLALHNENASDGASDHAYVATICRSFARAAPESHEAICRQLDRMVTHDRLLPSFRSAILAACVDTFAALRVAARSGLDQKLFLECARAVDGEMGVRTAGVRALARSALVTPAVLELLLDHLRRDASVVVRRAVLSGLDAALDVVKDSRRDAVLNVPQALRLGIGDTLSRCVCDSILRTEAYRVAVKLCGGRSQRKPATVVQPLMLASHKGVKLTLSVPSPVPPTPPVRARMHGSDKHRLATPGGEIASVAQPERRPVILPPKPVMAAVPVVKQGVKRQRSQSVLDAKHKRAALERVSEKAESKKPPPIRIKLSLPQAKREGDVVPKVRIPAQLVEKMHVAPTPVSKMEGQADEGGSRKVPRLKFVFRQPKESSDQKL